MITPQWYAPRKKEISKEKANEPGANYISEDMVKEQGAKEQFGKLTETMFKETGSGTSRRRRNRAGRRR